MTTRKAYPSDVSDEEWAFVAPYLTLLPEDAGQRRYELREVFNALRWIVRTGAPWRMIRMNCRPGGLSGGTAIISSRLFYCQNNDYQKNI